MNARESLISFLRRKFCSRAYADSSDGAGDYDYGHAAHFAACGYCGWDGPVRDDWREAERDRWRHPDLFCWLRAFWVDTHGLRVWR